MILVHILSIIKQTVTISLVTVFIFSLLAACTNDQYNQASAPVPHVVTADIQKGIENHIDKKTQLGNGYFSLIVDGKELSLKLVRIHTEYLATLGPQSHFACVDLADTKGDVYDVDFFLSGDPGEMVVTETIPHKINGKPFYFWKQNEDKTWGRVSVDEASQQIMGIIVPNDEFDFRYRVFLPKIDGSARLWIPRPETDTFQTINVTAINAPAEHRILQDEKHGNTVFFWELDTKDSEHIIDIRYHVKRIEKAAYVDTLSNPSTYLHSDVLTLTGKKFFNIASEVVAGKKGDLVRARALYDHVIERLRYAKAGEGWGQGNPVFACDSRHGNCTDFHSYFVSLARSIEIPARFAIGAAIPSTRDDGGVDGYHCWVEFHAEGKWWPVDISEADKYSTLSTYYFGHHPANRLEFSRGRNLVLDPGPASGAINFLAYPVLEIDGRSVKAKIDFSFSRTR